MTRRGIAFFLFLAVLSIPEGSFAGCVTDCDQEYEAAREDCVATYDDPDDADSLQMCLEDAKEAYEDCEDECRS